MKLRWTLCRLCQGYSQRVRREGYGSEELIVRGMQRIGLVLVEEQVLYA